MIYRSIGTLALLACLIGFRLGSAQAGELLITGAGSTFAYPLYSKWFSDYRSVDPSIKLNYQSIGSGGGIRQLLDKTVDFGASDAPMTDEQLKKSAVPILHLPVALGSVVLTYNLPGYTGVLKLDSDLIAEIFLGKITSWGDPKLLALNPNLPKSLAISVAHRADGSGTTAVFSDYLAKVSADWKSKVGAGTALEWPVGLGGKGNEGVTGLVKQAPGAIGYVELIYALNNHLPAAHLKNAAGQFVEATPKSTTAAAASLKEVPADFRISITNAGGKDAYPISAFTYLLVYQTQPKEKGSKLVQFVKWGLSKGQDGTEALGYARVPKTMLPKILKSVDQIQLN